ncbi:MAG: chemotaxis protein CheW [Planctomycetota bacterium]|nr:chemotaxis protein CheW [Planctomycetota bacterium]
MNSSSATSSERYCVFACHTTWLAISAASVREVCPTPPLVRIPTANTLLAGLCHLRNEFLPVIQLEAFADGTGESRMIVVSGSQGNWALLTQQIGSLEHLEVSHVSSYGSDEIWSAAVLGSAFYRNRVVQIVEPSRLYRLVEQSLNRNWKVAQTSASEVASIKPSLIAS